MPDADSSPSPSGALPTEPLPPGPSSVSRPATVSRRPSGYAPREYRDAALPLVPPGIQTRLGRIYYTDAVRKANMTFRLWLQMVIICACLSAEGKSLT